MYQIVKVFLASPMDLQNERQLFRKTILQINEMIGKKIGVIFEVVCWEDYVIPDIGVDAQDVVNKQINMDYDIFFGLFGNRIGTSTNRSISGTVEEYERAKLLKTTRPDLKIMCYFLGGEDNEDIANLKKQLNNDGTLFHEINDGSQFANEAYKHFTSILLEISKKLQGQKQAPIHKDYLNRSVAVAVISQNKVIIVKRNKNSKFGGGSWQIPGGKIEAGESSRFAGIREIKEELGISINENQLEYIGTFSDKDISDRTKTIQIELFICLIDNSSDQVVLNHENEEWQWINISDLLCLDIPIFGINKKMLISVWREFAIARKLEIILDSFDEYSNSFSSRIEGVNDCELNTLYGFLSLLGIVQNTNRIIPASDYSKKIIEALICISRSGGCVFNNDNVDTLSSLGLTKNDFSVFSSNRSMMTYSHKALLAVLSSMAEMKNSRRNVCDVLIFGQYQGKIYLLLRWDFLADKYQLVSEGLKGDFQPGEYEKNAKYVVSHRLGEVICNGFDFFGMGQFSTKHFSGGSVDNDPILRTYYVDVVSARAKREDMDAATIIDSINEATSLSIEFSESISKEDTKELTYYRWCDVDMLFKQKNTYLGKRVQGIDELISKLGESAIRNHIKNPIPICEPSTEEQFDSIIKQYRNKSQE